MGQGRLGEHHARAARPRGDGRVRPVPERKDAPGRYRAGLRGHGGPDLVAWGGWADAGAVPGPARHAVHRLRQLPHDARGQRLTLLGRLDLQSDGVRPAEPRLLPGQPRLLANEPWIQPGPLAREPGFLAREPGLLACQPGVQPDEPGLLSDEPGLLSDEPGVQPDEPGLLSDESGLLSDEPGVQPDEPGVQPDEPGLQPDLSDGRRRRQGRALRRPHVLAHALAAQEITGQARNDAFCITQYSP